MKKKILTLSMATFIGTSVLSHGVPTTIAAKEEVVRDEKEDSKGEENTQISGPAFLSEKSTLGTLQELFPNVCIQNNILSQLRDVGESIDVHTPVTQEQLDKVKRISSNGTIHFSNEGIKNLHLLRNVTEISLFAHWTLESSEFFWDQIAQLKELEVLDLYQPEYSNGETASLTIRIPYLPKLKTLNLSWWGVAPQDKPFSIASTHIFDGSTINGTNLPSLETLRLPFTSLDNYDGIGSLQHLTSLDLSDSKIKNINFVKQLSNLTEINISSGLISDFSPLKDLKKLTKVSAGGQRNYFYKETAISYNELTKELALPAKIINMDGTTLTAASFSQHDISNPHFDANTSVFRYENVEDNSFKKYNFWVGDYDANLHIAKPYVPEKAVKIAWSEPLPNNLGTVDGILIYEINQVQEVPPFTMNHIPTINATDKILTVGDTFNPLDGVTAHDTEDGDIELTEANIITNNVNTNQAGTYSVTYKVTDSQGASIVKTITVVVNPKLEGLNHIPTINATDKILTVGDTFNPLDGVTAHDTEDGDIELTEANIIANDVNTNQAGVYSVTYKVSDSQGASTVKTITVIVNEKDAIPVDKPDNITASKLDKLPQTGDVSNLGFLGLMFVGSSGMLLGLNRKKRKK